MGRGIRDRAGHRGGQVPDRPRVRVSTVDRGDLKNPEDDPLRDLRPEDEEYPADPAADEYVWPELTDENEEDD